jgi:hypothetical protein
MMHVPGSTIVTVVPATVHTVGVLLENVTVRPELAVALTMNVPPLENCWSAGAGKSMVWFRRPMVMFCDTVGAAA